jgi:DNA-binding MarR family transcriptional regulator
VNRTINSTTPVLDSPAGRAPSAVGRLRLAYELGRNEMLARVRAAGHPDVTTAMIALFRFAGVHERRPGAIASTARLSKQATNDMLRELERQGYVERHPDPNDGRARIIQLTARGKALDRAVWKAGRDVEQAWREQFGDAEWTVFNDVLEKLIRPRAG